MTARKTRFNMTIESELLVALHQTAADEDRSVSAIIRRACWEYVREQGLAHP